jgi:hypothetical protein
MDLETLRERVEQNNDRLVEIRRTERTISTEIMQIRERLSTATTRERTELQLELERKEHARRELNGRENDINNETAYLIRQIAERERETNIEGIRRQQGIPVARGERAAQISAISDDLRQRRANLLQLEQRERDTQRTVSQLQRTPRGSVVQHQLDTAIREAREAQRAVNQLKNIIRRLEQEEARIARRPAPGRERPRMEQQLRQREEEMRRTRRERIEAEQARMNFEEEVGYFMPDEMPEQRQEEMIEDMVPRLDLERTREVHRQMVVPAEIEGESADIETISAADISNMIKCPVCLGKIKDVRLNCGHLICRECARTIRSSDATCPQCRAPITNMDRIYYNKYLKYKMKYFALKNKK